MQDLTLVGADDDGEHLVLATPDGTRFRLRADDALRLAARRGRPAPTAPGGPPAPLTPREIQSRLRAGEDAAEIAAATGTGEERVRRYEGPVLAEREHVAAQARVLPVRWRDGSGRSPALEDLVAERLGSRGAEGPPAWDAWRREDGAWLVQAVFRAGARERRATWSLDLRSAHLEALDDEARWLSSVDVAEGAVPPPGPAVPRLAAVREEVYDVDEAGTALPAGGGRRRDAEDRSPVDLARRRGERADRDEPRGETRRRAREEPGAAPEQEPAERDEDVAAREEADRRERAGRTLDLLEHLRGRRGRRQPLADPDDEELEALTWAELEALTSEAGPAVGGAAGAEDGSVLGEDPWDAAGEPPAAHPPASRPEEALDDGVLALEPLDGVAAPDGGAPAEDADAAPDEETAGADRDGSEGEPSARSRRRRRRGQSARASEEEGVPGQEELMPEPPRPTSPRPTGADRARDEDGAAAAEGSASQDDGEPAPPRPARRGARPSVPSWDDIVFGQKRD